MVGAKIGWNSRDPHNSTVRQLQGLINNVIETRFVCKADVRVEED